jgi:hypothetical protein
VPRGLHLPWRLIIRRFELSDKTFSKTNFEPAIPGRVRRASGLLPPRSYLVGYLRWHAGSDSGFFFLLQTIIPTAFRSQVGKPYLTGKP